MLFILSYSMCINKNEIVNMLPKLHRIISENIVKENMSTVMYKRWEGKRKKWGGGRLGCQFLFGWGGGKKMIFLKGPNFVFWGW